LRHLVKTYLRVGILQPDHDDHPCRDERANAVASGVLARHCQTHSPIPATTGTGGRRRGQVSTREQREKPQYGQRTAKRA
jgi:hypothetical protein